MRLGDFRGARYLAAAACLIAAVAAPSAGQAGVYGIDRQPDNGWRGSHLVLAAAESAEVSLSAFKYKDQPEPLAEISFVDADNKPRSIADWRGKVVLLNLWATWCAPCRREMPSLDRLQKALGGKDFEVVALSVDRAGLDASRKFLDQTGSTNLGLYVDPTARAATGLDAVGMPTTLLIDRDGREVGRLVGPTAWDSDEAKALIAKVLR